jgi:hypothetical protein
MINTKENVMTKQPKDDAGAIVPLLGLGTSRGLQVPYTAAASNASAQLSLHTKIVTVTPSTACFIEIGNSAVSASNATSHYLSAGVPYDIVVRNESSSANVYIAVIGASDSGRLYISERV